MDETTQAVQSIEELFSTAAFPDGFLEKYDQLECLSRHKGLETFLVQEKGGERLFVAKCYDRSIYTGARETGVFRTLRHEGLPAFADEWTNKSMVCVVRGYVEGTPLDRYAKENELTREQVIRLCIELCDILTYLHEQEPPVIHRDIKPQNIIVRKNGKPVLIDFDAARTYKLGASTDTQFFGTRAYAPPEQYGLRTQNR